MSELIPLDWYHNKKILLAEEKMFACFPRYCGHMSMVPNLDDFYTLESTNNTKMLVHNHHGIALISNICRHRQAIMRQGKGNQQYVFCPAHH